MARTYTVVFKYFAGDKAGLTVIRSIDVNEQDEAVEMGVSINRLAELGLVDYFCETVNYDENNFACFDMSELDTQWKAWRAASRGAPGAGNIIDGGAIQRIM